MLNGSPIIFLLWGHHFDEAVAAIFVGELRKAGLCVKVVGLEGRPTAGAHGLMVTPDLPLGQIPRLAQRGQAIIIPCPLTRLLRYAHDPRLAHFLQEAQHRQACFIMHQGACDEPTVCQWAETMNLLLPIAPLVVYPDCLHLVSFVRTLAIRLPR